MTKTLRFLPALGAVLFAFVGLSACGGGGIPGNAVVQVGDTSITKATFDALDAGRLRVDRGDAAASRSCRNRRTTPPASRTSPRRRRNPPRARSRPPPRSSRRSAHSSTSRCSRRCSGFLISSDWVLGEADALGVKADRRGSQEAVPENQEPAVPQARGIRKIPRHVGPDGFRSAAAREAESCSRRKSRRRSSRTRAKSPTRRSEVLQQEQVALRHA